MCSCVKINIKNNVLHFKRNKRGILEHILSTSTMTQTKSNDVAVLSLHKL